MRIPQFSIVLCTHLRPELLQRAIDSLLGQTYQDFEVIVVSDVLDIETLNVVRSKLRPNDSLIMNPNLLGPSESRNLGADISKGKWLLFLDDDDALHENCLEKFATREPEVQSDVYFTDYIKVIENRESNVIVSSSEHKIGEIKFDSILYRNYIPNSSVIVRADIARKVKFDSRLDSHEDWDWLINLGRIVPFKHLPFIGPIIFEDLRDSRNQKSKDSKEIAFDYLSVYRKWRTTDSLIIKLRERELIKLGLRINQKFL